VEVEVGGGFKVGGNNYCIVNSVAEVRELNGKFRGVAGTGDPGMCGYLSYRYSSTARYGIGIHFQLLVASLLYFLTKFSKIDICSIGMIVLYSSMNLFLSFVSFYFFLAGIPPVFIRSGCLAFSAL